MISKLAKDTVEGWMKEGLKPTFDDCIYLNALGLKVEKGSDTADFAALPRCAFLGDYVLWEPTIKRSIWIDKAQMIVGDSFLTKILTVAFGLWCEEKNLPDLNDAGKLIDEIQKFANEALADKTQNQILAAIDYVLNGNDPTSGEDFKDDEQAKAVVEFPKEIASTSQLLLNDALDWGIDMETASQQISKNLQRMILTAIARTGADVKKNIQMRNSGEFFVACGKIHERLKKEKENG